MGENRNAGMVIAVLTAIAFAGSGPFVKPLLIDGWTPGAAVIVRMIGAAAILVPVALWQSRHDFGVWKRRWKWLVGYGLIAMAAAQYFYYASISYMPVGVALLIQYLAPVLLLIVAWIQTKYRPAAMSLVGSVLAVAGLLFALDLGAMLSGGGLHPLGVTFAACAAISICGYYLLAAAIPDDLPPTVLIGGGLIVGATALSIVGATGLVPLAATFDTVTLFNTEMPWWVTMAVVVVVGTVCGYLGGVSAARILGSRLASFFGLLEVLATIAVSALLLGEIPTWMQAIGAALVIGGVVCVRLAPDTVTVDAPLGPVTAPITLPLSIEDAIELGEIREHVPEDFATSAIPVIRDVETMTAAIPIIGTDHHLRSRED